MEHYLSYVEILDMFENERFSSDDPNIDAYRNIQKIRIHIVVSFWELFPDNDTTNWCFSYLQKDTGLIVNYLALSIASLKENDIRARYQTQESTVSLNVSFLKQFGVEHQDFETLMKYCFYNEEWLGKKGERYIPAWYFKSPYRFINTMIYRLYGEESITHFRME